MTGDSNVITLLGPDVTPAQATAAAGGSAGGSTSSSTSSSSGSTGQVTPLPSTQLAWSYYCPGTSSWVGPSQVSGSGSSTSASSGSGAGGSTTTFTTLAGGYVESGSWQGYAWTSTETPNAGTTISPGNVTTLAAGGQLCAQGVVGASYADVGIVGINVDQIQNVAATANDYTPTGTGISYSVSATASSPLRLQPQNAAGTRGVRTSPLVPGRYRTRRSIPRAGVPPRGPTSTLA